MMRSIELFAGCGGLALGLARAGWDGLFAVERDPMAFETLRRNLVDPDGCEPGFDAWPDWLPRTNLDLIALLDDPEKRAELIKLRGQISLVAGGPPCQGFSAGGRRDGADVRNQLVYRMLEFVSLVQPDAVLIENVEGIARRFVARPGDHSQESSVAEQVASLLKEDGYSTAIQIVDSSDYGVPQVRRRVVIIGLKGSVSAKDLTDRLKSHLQQAALQVRKRYGLPIGRSITAWEAIQDLASPANIPCPDSAGYLAGTYSPAESAFSQAMRQGQPTSAVPDSHRFSKHGPRVSALYELALATEAKGRLPKSFLLANGTKKDKKVLLDPDAPSSTITTHPDEFIHCVYPRNVTVREMARLQSFPDKFHFFGRYTINGPRRKYDVARCSQVGNAVPPLMAEALGLAVKRMIEENRAPARALELA
jgi:DNA (cytosine-5)-methyltransferase 1